METHNSYLIKPTIKTTLKEQIQNMRDKRREDEPRDLVDFKLNTISDQNEHFINKGNRHPIG